MAALIHWCPAHHTCYRQEDIVGKNSGIASGNDEQEGRISIPEMQYSKRICWQE